MYWPQQTITFSDSPFTVALTTRVLWVNAAGGNIVVNLPDASGTAGIYFIIKKIDTSSNTITLNPPAGKTIDGFSSYVITTFNQIVGLTADTSGNYKLVDGNMSGSAVGIGRVFIEKTDGSVTLGTSPSDISGMSQSLTLDVPGNTIINVSGNFDRAGNANLFRGTLIVNVDGTDYNIGETNQNNGSGGDNTTTLSVSGTFGIFLSAGAHTIKVRASANPGSSALLATSSYPTSLTILYPTITIFGGGSPTSDPTNDLAGSWNSPTVVGLQNDKLPSKIADGFLKRNFNNTAWEDVTYGDIRRQYIRDATNQIRLDEWGVPTDITLLNSTNKYHGLLPKLIDITNQFLRSDGNWAVPTSSGSGSGADMAEVMLFKSFFTDNGFMPANTAFEATKIFQPTDFANLNSGTKSISMSRAKFTQSGSPANYGWDSGASRSKMLFIIGMTRTRTTNTWYFLTDTNPTTSEIPAAGYAFLQETNSSRYSFGRGSGLAGFTSESSIDAPHGPTSSSTGIAIYWEVGRVILFVRHGFETWFPVMDISDSTYSTLRYAGIRFEGTGSGVWYHGCPMALYYTA